MDRAPARPKLLCEAIDAMMLVYLVALDSGDGRITGLSNCPQD